MKTFKELDFIANMDFDNGFSILVVQG